MGSCAQTPAMHDKAWGEKALQGATSSMRTKKAMCVCADTLMYLLACV